MPATVRKQRQKLYKDVLRSLRYRVDCVSRKAARVPRISRPYRALPATRTERVCSRAKRIVPRPRSLAPKQRATRREPRPVVFAGTRLAHDFTLKPTERRRAPRTHDTATATAQWRCNTRRSVMRTREHADLFARWLRATRARKLAAQRARVARTRNTLAVRRRVTQPHALAITSRSYAALR